MFSPLSFKKFKKAGRIVFYYPFFRITKKASLHNSLTLHNQQEDVTQLKLIHSSVFENEIIFSLCLCEKVMRGATCSPGPENHVVHRLHMWIRNES